MKFRFQYSFLNPLLGTEALRTVVGLKKKRVVKIRVFVLKKKRVVKIRVFVLKKKRIVKIRVFVLKKKRVVKIRVFFSCREREREREAWHRGEDGRGL